MPDARNLGFADRYWTAPDGLKLHYRDYPGSAPAAGRPPVMCLPGLTRNARDFEGVAARLAGQGWRVLCVNLRGRGGSAPAKDAASYVPATYVADVRALFEQAEIARAVTIGTSLGGLVAMGVAAAQPERWAGAVLNDVGPVVEPDGLARIRAATGRGGWWPTWMHAARATAELHGDAFPDYAIEDWLRMAKRLNRLNSAGRIVPDYDQRIAEAFRAPSPDPVAGPPADPWTGYDALAANPLLVVRGARSDILSAATARAMAERPGVELVTLAGLGHAPTLEEPDAAAAIDRLLARVAEG